jgi:Zn-dependent peptidase ImmA (M78 family)
MNELTRQGDKRMTVREVAEMLGVTEEAVKRKMLPTTKVVGSITDLEAAEMLLKSAEHFKARFEQERERRIEAEDRLSVTEPQAEVLDKITATKKERI